ncbi:hypothetical protein BJX99DRAFT_242142 [Aspergillus californicus]
MTVAFDNPPLFDLRPPTFPARDPGVTMMEIMHTEDKSRNLPQYSSGPTPPMHRIPPPETAHGLPGTPGMYDQSWRSYPPSFEPHPPDPRRPSNPPQPPPALHTYPPMHSRELPQLTSDGHYGRPAGLPAPAHAPSEPPPPLTTFHPMNGISHESSPLSAPPDFTRARMSFPPQDQPHTNGDGPLPQSLPASQYTPAVPPASHTPVPYESGYYHQGQSYGMRHRRAARAQQACDQCRARKAKCDEGRPACSHCKENSLICVYKEVPPHKQEKSTQLLLDRLQQFEDHMDTKLRDLEKLHVGHDKALDEIKIKVGWSTETQKQAQTPVVKSDPAESFQIPNAKDLPTANGGNRSDSDRFAKELLMIDGEDGPLSIPVEHTTAAHKLLGWPSIIKLLQPHRYDDHYVMKLERYRGLIRTDGRGEEKEPPEAMSFPEISFNSSLDESYTQSHTASPAGTWNCPKFNDTPPEVRGIDESGLVHIDGDTVRRYRDSFLVHIHRLHPFLDQRYLMTIIEQFIDMHCPRTTQSGPGLHAMDSTDAPRSAKRKRSTETQSSRYDTQSPTGGQRQRVEKSIPNAIILLVLALGRICEVREEPIRGPCTDQVIDYRNEPIPGVSPRGAVSPGETDSMPPPQGNYYPSYQKFSPTTSVLDDKFTTYPDPHHLENVDTVPGWIYYRFAANILGPRHGAVGLSYVQATLLAGLYAGQLAHSFQSNSWVAQAAKACQVLTLPKSYGELADGPYKDLVNFAYWTCLQLESDILAELDLPASGVSRSQSRIALPNGKFTLQLPNNISAPNTMMMFFYNAQIHLRKVLNRVHTDLYKLEKHGETRWSSNIQEILSVNLELWRSSLPPEMKWADSDGPSPDINVARMRAKYYGARYIIHRPLLYHSLHYTGPNMRLRTADSPAGFEDPGTKHQQASPLQTNPQHATDMPRISSDLNAMQRAIGLTAHSYRDLPQKLRAGCKSCVDAAIMSTEAFDAVRGRPVVTNIFGTAHAQFGNMLVLSTTYMSHLSDLVKREDIERLLRRTIAFLLRNRNISPTLRADAKILADIYERIFGEPPMFTAEDG